jgi:hypothetical protein
VGDGGWPGHRGAGTTPTGLPTLVGNDLPGAELRCRVRAVPAGDGLTNAVAGLGSAPYGGRQRDSIVVTRIVVTRNVVTRNVSRDGRSAKP